MSEVVSVSEMFGKDVFNDAVMKDRLPKSVYKKLKKTIEDGAELDPSIADVVAHAMKDWAIEHGATHFTHWFQPLTGVTAEKHDSFISAPVDGKVIMDGIPKEIFSRVKELKEHGLDVPQATELAFELKEAGMPLTEGILSRQELVEQLTALLSDEK